MNETIGLSLASSLIGGLVVAIANHFMTKRREREQRKREFVLKFLVDAWQNLEAGSRNEIDIHQKSKALEKAIADIQLFGSPAQIQMANTLAKEMVSKGSSGTTDLLADLQKDLRRELGLHPSPVRLFFFRLTPKIPKSSSGTEEVRFCSGSVEAKP